MNSNWRNRPTTIDYLSSDIDYIISIDESGSPNLKQVLKAKQAGIEADQSEKHFIVTACNINKEDFITARDMVMEVKRKYWNNALFDYAEGVKRVCFHSREIRKHQGAFDSKVIDYDAFITDLSKLMSKLPYKLYAAHIDKEKHVNQYLYPDSPYDLCMTFVLERIMRDIPQKSKCVVVLESRGAKEDKELLNFIKQLIDYGTQYCSRETFSRISGVYFNPKWCEMAEGQMSYWELELADLCAYPIQKYFTYGTKDKAFETLVPKISCYPNISGRGLKSFP